FIITLIERQELYISGERNVPIDSSVLGFIGQQSEPAFKQFIIKKPDSVTQEAFEKQLIRIRLQFEFSMQKEEQTFRPHIISASSWHVTYKSLTMEDKLDTYFQDLKNQHFTASGGISHSRYTTNTRSTFKNVQPFNF